MESILIWDTEALNMKRDDEEWPHYRERAGISMAAVYDVRTTQLEFYDQAQCAELATKLESADDVVSYNGVTYDHCVLDSVLGRRVYLPKETDLWLAIKHNLDRAWPKGSWTLDATCTRTLGQTKEHKGAYAPQLFAEGKLGELMTYLAKDVWLTHKLWEFIREYGYVVDPSGHKLQIGVMQDGFGAE